MGPCYSGTSRHGWDRVSDYCFRLFPYLSEPGRRSAVLLKLILVMLHLIFAGIIFLFDRNLIEKTRQESWYTAMYLLLFVATLALYFWTSGSSPGYVMDAMRTVDEKEALIKPGDVITKQPASSKSRDVVVTIDRNQLGRSISGSNISPWMKLVMEMYPPGTSIRSCTCTHCNVVQPPRAKHCHDCDRCVLQFDHHCVWLGTCVGQGNHCLFWWYICEETVLCLWTGVLYITYLKTNISKAWWIYLIMIFLLAILSISLIFLLLLFIFHSYLIVTNQTTYELVRRRSIQYMRRIPERVYPFSKGVCRNLYNFCCNCSSRDIYSIERVPTPQELAENSRPYTCFDLMSCRCCC